MSRSGLRNRVDPWGDLRVHTGRGTLTGNRGCLIRTPGVIGSHQQISTWISCLLEFKGWHHPVSETNTWTPLFFLDEAVALAAGHRPCATCRRPAFRSYCLAVARSLGSDVPIRATEIDRRLKTERYVDVGNGSSARGFTRWADRRLWTMAWDELPVGAVVVMDGQPVLVQEECVRSFSFDGWGLPLPRPRNGEATVLTPPTSVAALSHGYTLFNTDS